MTQINFVSVCPILFVNEVTVRIPKKRKNFFLVMSFSIHYKHRKNNVKFLFSASSLSVADRSA